MSHCTVIHTTCLQCDTTLTHATSFKYHTIHSVLLHTLIIFNVKLNHYTHNSIPISHYIVPLHTLLTLVTLLVSIITLYFKTLYYSPFIKHLIITSIWIEHEPCGCQTI